MFWFFPRFTVQHATCTVYGFNQIQPFLFPTFNCGISCAFVIKSSRHKMTCL